MTETPIRIFVGCAANNEDLESQAVLEWSIRKHTKREVEITWMMLSRDPASPYYSDGPRGWQTKFWTTPFSGLRWAVPELCNWHGRAVYSDSDVIYFADIGELWDHPFNGKVVVAKGGNSPRLCVSLWDCEAARRFLPQLSLLQSDPYSHRGLMQRFAQISQLVQPFVGGDWNRLDFEDFALGDPAVKAWHNTSIPQQMQLKYALPRLKREGRQHWYTGPVREHLSYPLRRLFGRLLDEAETNGYGIERYRREPFGQYEIRAGR